MAMHHHVHHAVLLRYSAFWKPSAAFSRWSVDHPRPGETDERTRLRICISPNIAQAVNAPVVDGQHHDIGFLRAARRF